MTDWSYLPGPVLRNVLAHLSRVLAHDEPLYVLHAVVPAANKHWAQACREVSPQLVPVLQCASYRSGARQTEGVRLHPAVQPAD